VAFALLLIGAVVGLVALVNLRGTARDSTGGICGSVWHWRSSDQQITGGEMSDTDRAALSAACHSDAVGRYDRGMALIWPSLGAAALGGILWLGTSITRVRQAA
jgi:hypothetical protein